MLGHLSLAAQGEQPPAGDRLEADEGHVLGHGEDRDEAVTGRVLGDQEDPLGYRLLGSLRVVGPAPQGHPPARGLVQPEQDPGQVVAAGADKAGHTDHLALADHEIDTVQYPRLQVAELERRRLFGQAASSATAAWVIRCPAIRVTTSSWDSSLAGSGGDELAVAEHGDPVGQAEDFFQVVRNVEHARRLRGQGPRSGRTAARCAGRRGRRSARRG